MMMAFIIIAQLVLDGGLRRVEGSVGASSKVLLAEIYKELATVRFLSRSAEVYGWNVIAQLWEGTKSSRLCS